MSVRQIRWAVVVLALVAIATAACGANSKTAANNATGNAATSAAPAQTAAASVASATAAPTVAATAAKATGDLTVYAALTQANGDALAKAFEAANPSAHVTMITGGTGALVTRINTEKSAGGVHADVIFLADPTAMDSLAGAGVLASYQPAAASSLPQGLTGKDWTGVLTFQNVIAYRTGISNPPADWTDLTKPALKGKVVIADPSYSGTTFGMAAELSSSLGWKYFQDLKTNGAKVEQSTNTVGTDIAQGMDDAGITLDSVVRDLVKKGAPITIVWPTSGSVPVPAPVGLSAGAKNQAAGKAFVDWLLTRAGQQEIVSLGYVPAVPGTPAGALIPAGAKQLSVDWATFGAQKDAILKQFHMIFP
jgi:iron(III) transport system substrate-binding protein